MNGLNELTAPDHSIMIIADFNRVVSDNLEKGARTIEHNPPLFAYRRRLR